MTTATGLDFNDAEPQRGMDLIPAGTLVRVVGVLRPGAVSRPGMEKIDGGCLTASKTSDVLYLSWEFTVVDGPYRNRKFWQNMTVAGGEVNEKGESKAWNITKSTLRAMLNSARGVKPDDASPQAAAARRIECWRDIERIEFACRVRINPARGDFLASNSIGQVIEPDHKDYAAIMGGTGAGDAPSAPQAAAAPTPAWAATPAATRPASGGNGAAVLPAWAR